MYNVWYPSTQSFINNEGLWESQVPWSLGYVIDPPLWGGAWHKLQVSHETLLIPISYIMDDYKVGDDPRLPGDRGEVPMFEWSGWRFNMYQYIFSRSF